MLTITQRIKAAYREFKRPQGDEVQAVVLAAQDWLHAGDIGPGATETDFKTAAAQYQEAELRLCEIIRGYEENHGKN